MKKFFLTTACALLAISISTTAFAQQQNKDKEKDKSGKNKLNDYDEIVIKRKGDKDGKVTVEIRNDEVLVNGKPLSEYDDENISVRKNRVSVWNGNARGLVAPVSPFRESLTFGNNAFLGVSTEKTDKGAKITSVTDKSAAEKAGLKEGDVITKVDDVAVEDHGDVSKAIGKHKPEDKVTVTVLRDGKEQKITATLGKQSWNGVYSMPSISAMPNFEFHDGFNLYAYGGRPRIGIRAQDTEDGKGVKVLDVAEESLAEKAGIKEGDIITEFDGKAVNSADDLVDAAKDTKEKNSFTVKYTRDGKAQTAEIKIPKKLKTANL